MGTRPFGPRKVPLPVIGQGTWMMERGDRRETIHALRRGVELGLTHVDTAEMYGAGEVEALVGEALQGLRDRVYVVSKVLPSNASFDGTLKACERSLKQLRTDRLDLYLLHWPGSHPLEDTIRAFEKLRTDGKIREWGVSNFDVEDLEQAARLAGPSRIACNQVLYHLEERAIEHAVLPWCEGHSIPVVAYSPLGQGRLPSPGSAGGKVLAEIASVRGATPAQVALRYLTLRPSVFAIPKAARVAHVEENAAAADVRLTDDDAARLDAAFPRGRRRSLPML